MNWFGLFGLLCALSVATCAPRVKRQLGEVNLNADAISPDRHDLIAAAHWATEQICHSRNSPVHLKFLQLVHAKEEAVESDEGRQWEMTIKLGETDCSKKEMDLSACLKSKQTDHHEILCTTTVLTRPWMLEPDNMKFISRASHLPPFSCQDLA